MEWILRYQKLLYCSYVSLCTFDLNSTLPCIQRGEMSVPIIVAVAAVVVPLAAVGVLPPPFL